jgi:thiamine biosynthesis lipoprotein
MKDSRAAMGMPITVEIADASASMADIDAVFAYFEHVNLVFSVHRNDSEISRINRGEVVYENYTDEVKEVLARTEDTRRVTQGYFDALRPNKLYDPSGVVKGWAIQNAYTLLLKRGFKNFFIEAGGDIALSGHNQSGGKWSVGIRNPFKLDTTVKTLYLSDCGIATSGNYLRGNHIYNPNSGKEASQDIVSVTVIGPNVYEADRFATAVYAMGYKGIEFIESLEGFEGYAIDKRGIATFTSGFEIFTQNNKSL